jgi:hypothetical protein
MFRTAIYFSRMLIPVICWVVFSHASDSPTHLTEAPAAGRDNEVIAETGGPGNLRAYRIKTDQSEIEVALAGEFELSDSDLIKWVLRAEKAVKAYYNRFPVDRLVVMIRTADGKRIKGVTVADDETTIEISLGRDATERELDEDWVMTHEMIHCTFPSVDRSRHAWIEEGIATYVEPFARLRAGELSAEKVWGDLVRSLPQGLPEPGDRGLDHTPTWGRTYWGGALFCLLADIEIRHRTQNRRGLEDALRGILQKGGNVNVRWDMIRALDEGDRATGVSVLNELYRSMKATPIEIDLPSLWERLGIKLQRDRVIFDDSAPLASVRRAITKGE